MPDDTPAPKRRRRKAVATIDKAGPEAPAPSLQPRRSTHREEELEAQVRDLTKRLRDAERAIQALRR